jgi:Dockerin type I domain
MKTPSCKTIVLAGMLLACAARADARMARVCDVTGNGTVTSVDANRVLRYVAGMWSFTPEQQLLADASGNGHVTAFDAVRILKAARRMVVPGSQCGTLIQLP